jgi:hypothetical protein
MARIHFTRLALSTAFISLAGCASLNQFTERHPVVAAVGATLIAGSIVATAEANGHGRSSAQSAAASDCQVVRQNASGYSLAPCH